MMRMTRTPVDADERALDAARRELGTTGLSETVNAALRDAAGDRRSPEITAWFNTAVVGVRVEYAPTDRAS